MAYSRIRDVVLERDPFWVLRVPKGFEVYENVGTHSVRRAHIGFAGAEGLDRATAQITRLEAARAGHVNTAHKFKNRED